jgi:hypothetical protein
MGIVSFKRKGMITLVEPVPEDLPLVTRKN